MKFSFDFVVAMIAMITCQAASAQSAAVQVSNSGNRVHMDLDLLQLRSDMDTLFERLGNAANSTLDWSQTLSSSTSPGTNLDLGGFAISNAGNITTSGTFVGDSLMISNNTAIEGRASIDSLIVTDVIHGQIHSLSNHNSDAIAEGTSHLFYSDERVLAAIADTLSYLIELIQSSGGSSGPCPAATGEDFVCGQSGVDFGGYVYCTVEIGGQCWFNQNLRTERYNNGVEIPIIPDGEEWYNTYAGARSVYNNNANGELEKYGYVYNLGAVENSGGICPSGWHVPTTTEFNSLVNFAGGSSVAGSKLKASESHPVVPWDGTDDFGFSALPGGYRVGHQNPGNWIDLGGNAYFWSSSVNGESGWQDYFRLIIENDGTFLQSTYDNVGLYVRCIRN